MGEPSDELWAAVDRLAEGWIVRLVTETAQRQLRSCPPELLSAAHQAGRQARSVVGVELGALLALDVDDQRSNPLTILRSAVRFATSVLEAAEVPHPARDEFAQRVLPDDVYGLAPATWADVDPALVEPGLMWGAWKAATVLHRRRREGRL